MNANNCGSYGFAFGATLLVALSVPTSARAAFQVVVAAGTGDAVTITDGGVGDTDGAVNDTIKFRQVIVAQRWGAAGTVTQVIAAGGATLTFTDCTIGHTGAVGGDASGRIDFQTGAFAAIGPPATAKGHLDGDYIKVGPRGRLAVPGPPHALRNADIKFEPSTNNGPIGAIDPPCKGGACVPAAPANADTAFNGTSSVAKAAGVTTLLGKLTFTVGRDVGAVPADGIALPGSAVVTVASGDDPTGTCCLRDETCDGAELLTLLECDALGVNFILGPNCLAAGCPGAGACCFSDGGCEILISSECDGLGVYLGDGSVCFGDFDGDGRDDACRAIPTVSEWGLIVMTVLVLTAGTIVFGRRRRREAIAD